MPRLKESDSQTGLPFCLSPSRDRTLEVHCNNCKARFVAWYGTDEDAETETVDFEKCGFCGGRQLQEGRVQEGQRDSTDGRR